MVSEDAVVKRLLEKLKDRPIQDWEYKEDNRGSSGPKHIYTAMFGDYRVEVVHIISYSDPETPFTGSSNTYKLQVLAPGDDKKIPSGIQNYLILREPDRGRLFNNLASLSKRLSDDWVRYRNSQYKDEKQGHMARLLELLE